VQVGDHPEATPVFDLDGTSLLDTVRVMRDESRFLSGRKLIMPPPLFIGATENPFVPPFDFPPLRLAKKVTAGAQFIQTQCCFDISRLQQFMTRVREMGLDEKCFILVGVGPLLSANAARWIRSHVRGIDVPDAIVHRLSHAKRQKLEGKKVCLELIQQVREIQGVSGIHVMAYRQEETIAEIIDASGVLDGRVPWYPGRSEGNDRTQAS
ncbi:MAG: methylenetetrahydrofolate reductase, partial [Acidiferrobacterales bacterium]